MIYIVEYESGCRAAISSEEIEEWIVIGQGEIDTGWGNIPTKSKKEASCKNQKQKKK